MADILIMGMEMPEYCYECPCHNGESGYCQAYKSGYLNSIERPAKCPLLPLPEGHGDLIDRDNVLLDIDCIGTNRFGMLDEDIRAFLRRYEPIVPAEGGTDDVRVM